MQRRFLTVLPVVTFVLTLLTAAPAWAQAALTVEKTDDPDPVTEGKVLTYTIVVENTGTQAATGVTLVDNLPANTTFVSAETPDGTCPVQPAPGAAGGTVQCNLGSLGPDQNATVTIKVKPTNAAAIAGTITNTATGDSDQTTPVVDQQSTSVTPGLSIVKEDSPGTIEVGDNLRYTLTVKNRGGSNAANVRVIDELPSEVEFLESDADQGNCDEQPEGVVECDIGTINAGATVRTELLVRATKTGNITNRAQVFAGDTEEAIDEDTETTQVEKNDNDGNGNNNGNNNGNGNNNTGSSCPGTQVEETLTGADNEETPKFHISGDSFRVKYNVTDVGDDPPLKISVLNDNGSTIETQNVNQQESDSFILNEGPGDFRVKVTATNADYTITVDDCTNSDQNGGGGGGNGGGGGKTKAANNQNDNVKVVVVKPPKQQVIKATIPRRVLPNTGGVPLAGLALIGFGLLVAGVSVYRFGVRRRL